MTMPRVTDGRLDVLEQALARSKAKRSPRQASGARPLEAPPISIHPSAPLLCKPEAATSLIVTRLSDVEPETVTWLWPGRIPWGKLALLEGDPGLGKSFFTLAVAAHVSGGRRLPGVDQGPSANVLIVSYEDGVADTIAPRCVAAGADLTRIHHVDGVHIGGEERTLTLPDHIPVLREQVERTRAKLVIIDPLAAALSGGVDGHKDQDVRRVLAPLAAMADATGAAVLVVRHLRKTSGGRAITAGGGSIGIIGAARVALCIGPAPYDSEHGTDTRIVAVVKSNLAPIPPSLVYRLASTETNSARIEWLGESTYTADELAAARDENGGESRTQLDDAEGTLRNILAHGEMPRKDVLAVTRRDGLHDKAVQRAASRIGVIMTRKGHGRDHASYWALPDDAPGPTQDSQDTTRDIPPRHVQSVLSEKDVLSGLSSGAQHILAMASGT